MKRFLSSVFLIIFSLVLSFFYVEKIFAQTATKGEVVATTTPTPTPTPIPPPIEAINLTLSPVTLQFNVKPGETQTAEVRIRNNSTEMEHLKASFGTFGFNQNTQDIDLSQEITTDDKNWITIDQSQFTVESQEWKTLKVTFSPPADAALTHYYALIFSRVVPAQEQGGAAQIQGAPAILILTNVTSPLGKRELQIDQFFAKQFWVEYLPQTFTLKMKNTGNIHLAPSGNIFIDGPGQKDLAVLTINPKNSLILPDSSREFEVEWNDGFPKRVPKSPKEQSDSNKTETKVEWNFSEADKFRIGKYTAHLLLVYDNGERDVPIESSISFWVIPWEICLAALLILIFVLIGLRSTFVNIWRSLHQSDEKKS